MVQAQTAQARNNNLAAQKSSCTNYGAYIDAALRGHYLGAWAVMQAIGHLTYGAQVLAVALPSPTERRPGVTEAAGAKKLAKYWAKAGLEPIQAAPKLVGQIHCVHRLRECPRCVGRRF